MRTPSSHTALLGLLVLTLVVPACGAAPAEEEYWVGPMRKVHRKFTGQRGTVAQFGDSITISRAFWFGLQHDIKNASPQAAAAHKWLRSYVQNRCWLWEGVDYGNEGGTTSEWGLKNMDRWLKKLNPEVALVMWGTNDTYKGPKPPQYTENLRAIMQKCLDNGTIPILYTIPPVGRQAGAPAYTKHVESFVEAARAVSEEKKVPLIDYYKEIITRRPADFHKTLLGDNLHPSAPREYTNDFSPEALKHHGYGLRNYLTLLKLYEVQQKVLSKVKSARTAASEMTWKGPTYEGLPAVLIPKPSKSPKVDGRLDDACWKALKSIQFRLLDGDTKKPTYPTWAKVAADSDTLYVAFRCAEPDVKNVVSQPRERDGQVWSDDAVEVFLKLGAQATRQYHQMTVNVDGSVYDAFGGDKTWNAGLKAAVHKGKDFWSAEIAVPFADMKLPANKARLRGPWRLNLTRMRPARGQAFTEETALAPTEHTSSHVPARFAYAFFEAFGGKLPKREK